MDESQRPIDCNVSMCPFRSNASNIKSLFESNPSNMMDYSLQPDDISRWITLFNLMTYLDGLL
jgi:hypothetical protein